jgi:hypothetical protein
MPLLEARHDGRVHAGSDNHMPVTLQVRSHLQAYPSGPTSMHSTAAMTVK